MPKVGRWSNWWQRLKVAIYAMRRMEGLDFPDAGRSSVEDTTLGGRLGVALGPLAAVTPEIDFEMLAVLKKLWLFNPDMAQYVANLVHLGNTGHSVKIDAANTARAEAVTARLNELAARLYQHSAGADGLISAYLQQMAWSGALSSEDVVNFGGRRIEQTVIVPVERIRFTYEEGRYVAHQSPRSSLNLSTPMGWLRLSEETYRYYALSTVENSPYAKPPATAAVEMILGAQTDALGNIAFIARKAGLLGLVSVSVTPPPKKPSETEAEYQARAKAYLTTVRESLDGNFNKGLMVTYRDQKVETTSVTANAAGTYEMIQVIEQQIMSAFAMPPAFFGRTDSTTETYADVVWGLLVAQVGNLQRLAKRRLERTYRLDLRLGGVEVEGLSVAFNQVHSRNLLEVAQAREVEVRTILSEARAGMLSPDEAAQKLGYESAFDPEMLHGEPDLAHALGRGVRAEAALQRVTLKFDRDAQRYRYAPEVIELAANEQTAFGKNVIPLKKKAV